jgi:sulfur carrier protein ThiS
MPMVTVHLHTIFQKQTPKGLENKIFVSIKDYPTPKGLLDSLNIDVNNEAVLLVVNGKIVPPTHQLEDGDEVHLIPAISGGMY